jgi:hypothetical protein
MLAAGGKTSHPHFAVKQNSKEKKTGKYKSQPDERPDVIAT